MAGPPSHLVVTENDDGAVVLNKKSGQYFRLNPLGREIFRRIHDGQSLPTIIEELQAQFPAAREKIPQDVGTLVAGLRRAELVPGR
jgi:hypothetical protein